MITSVVIALCRYSGYRYDYECDIGFLLHSFNIDCSTAHSNSLLWLVNFCIPQSVEARKFHEVSVPRREMDPRDALLHDRSLDLELIQGMLGMRLNYKLSLTPVRYCFVFSSSSSYQLTFSQIKSSTNASTPSSFLGGITCASGSVLWPIAYEHTPVYRLADSMFYKHRHITSPADS